MSTASHPLKLIALLAAGVALGAAGCGEKINYKTRKTSSGTTGGTTGAVGGTAGGTTTTGGGTTTGGTTTTGGGTTTSGGTTTTGGTTSTGGGTTTTGGGTTSSGGGTTTTGGGTTTTGGGTTTTGGATGGLTSGGSTSSGGTSGGSTSSGGISSGGTSAGGTTSSGGTSSGGTTSGGTTSGGTTSGGTTSGGTTSGGTTSGGTTSGGTTSGGTSSGGTSSGGTTTAGAGVGAIEVNTATLNVRSGPGTGFDIIGESHQGESYVAFETSGSWRRIWYNDGPGWIHGGYTQASAATVRAVTADNLNVRSGPGTQYGVVGHVFRGMLRAVVATQGDWRKIDFAGAEAWVHGSYLGDPAAAPAGTQIAPALPQSTRGFIQFPASGSGFFAYSVADRRWGVPRFVYGVLRLAKEHAAANPTWGRIGIGEISLENGGPISGHASHQKGVDGDFRLQTTNGSEGPLTINDALYSRSRTQNVIDRFYSHLPVTMIFFNDTQVTGVTTWPNHENHFHVRIAE